MAQYIDQDDQLIHLNYDKCVATTGFFDGVHLGHQAVLQRVIDVSKQTGLPSLVITFWPHPRILLQQGADRLRLLSTLEEKKKLILDAGIDHFVVLPFTFDFSLQTAEEFICNYLARDLGVKHLLVGYDHHIGRGGTASYEQIKQICYPLDISVEQVAPNKQNQLSDDGGAIESVNVSSSKIRDCILHKQLYLANTMLGYTYCLSGKVVHGSKLGRELGYPTANIVCSEELKLIPPIGIYAVWVEVDQNRYGGMLYVGKRPTINSSLSVLVEVCLFDFNANIYDCVITVYFEHYLRTDVKFDNITDLKNQLAEDAIQSKSKLGLL